MDKRGNLKHISFLATFVVALLIASSIVFSDPKGPDTITVAGSGAHLNETGPVKVDAKAGNVTALVVSQTRSTESWQGYYGNITGTITLDNADNFTLYDWSLPNPSGEIYASNFSIVTWSNIYCMNVSGLRNVSGANGAGGSQGIIYRNNGTQLELDFGINSTDLDGLNETFNDTYVDATGFRVGGITIDRDDGCSMAHPYQSESNPNNAWTELLLTDNTSLVFTGIIRESADGFQPGATDTYDFQILVLEDGHTQNAVPTTPYYFFVELN